MNTYKINDFLKVIENGNEWNVFIDGELVNQHDCDLFYVPPEAIINSEEYISADEYVLQKEYKKLSYEHVCHILEVWYEHSYDTFLVYSRGAFPLLKKLYIAGDPLAEQGFTFEIEKRLELGESFVVSYLVEEGYLDYLNKGTIERLKNDTDVGSYLKNAIDVKKFLFRYHMFKDCHELWRGFPDLQVDETEIDVGFVKRMGIYPQDEGGVFFEILLNFNSKETIEKLASLTDSEILEILKDILTELEGKQEIKERDGKEFIINKFLKLKLIDDTTFIYVKGQPFGQCKYLLLNILTEDVEFLDDIESIDEAAEKLDISLERENVSERSIPPETEFWGHSSNLQVWAESGYDTCLLHSNLAFPLLKKLSMVGDINAKNVFKEEIAKRFASGYPSVVRFLSYEGYLDNLEEGELEPLIESTDDLFLKAHLGFYYANKRQWVKGFEFYTKLKMNKGTTPDTLRPYSYFWDKLHDFYFELGDYANSAQALEIALELDPDIRLGWQNLGHMYRHAGDYKKALKAYQHVIERGDKDTHTYSHLALVYEKIEEPEKALECSKKALKLDPKNPVAKNIISRINDETQ